MVIKLDREYEVKCTLGTIKEIESRFEKPFYAVIADLDKMTTTEQIKLLYAGVRRADGSIKESEFISVCEEHMGLGDLTDHLNDYIMQLQYPGKSTDEMREILEKKAQSAEKLRALIGKK